MILIEILENFKGPTKRAYPRIVRHKRTPATLCQWNEDFVVFQYENANFVDVPSLLNQCLAIVVS